MDWSLGVLLLMLQVQSAVAAGDCKKLTSCSCQNAEGVIDLTPLARTDGIARYADISDPAGVLFSWNPCSDFTEGDCKKVSACQVLTSTNFGLGTQDSAKFTYDEHKGLVLSYSQTWSDGVERVSHVTLVCDQSKDPAEFVAIGESADPVANYYFTLSSKYACPTAPSPTSHPDSQSSSLSVGSVLLIVVAVALVLYLSVGISVQVLVRHQPRSNAVPGQVFWVALPGLVKEGVCFTVGKCRKRNGYDQV